MKHRKICDPSLTLKISNEIVNYDLSNDYLIRGQYEINKWRKNGYLAYDLQGEEIGVIFADDDIRHKSYNCAYLLYFKKYTARHNVGVWRVIKPINTNGYVKFESLEHELKNYGSLTITTTSTFHYQ